MCGLNLTPLNRTRNGWQSSLEVRKTYTANLPAAPFPPSLACCGQVSGFSEQDDLAAARSIAL